MKSVHLCPTCSMPLDWIELSNGLHKLFCGQVACKSDPEGAEVDCKMGQDVLDAYELLLYRHERKQEGA
jgi:hypothetical protein